MRVDKTKWERKAFPLIGCSQLGKTLDSNKNTGKPYPYLCAANVKYGEFDLSNIKEILLEDNELEKYAVKYGDLLICEGGDTGRCAIWELDKPIYYQNALHRVRCNDGIYNKFIMYSMHYYKKTGVIDRLSHGRTIKHFTQKGLNQLNFYIPKYEIQQAIATELDAIQTMIDGHKAQLNDLDALAQSIFFDMFGDPVSNPKGWNVEMFGKLFSLKSGESLSKKNFKEGKYPVYGGNGISGYHNTFNKDGEFIIIGRVGAYCGNVRLVKDQFWITDNAFELKLIEMNFNYYFLSMLLNLLKLGDKTKATAQPVISNVSLKNLSVIIPMFSLQQQFANKIEAIEKQKELIKSQLTDTETLMAERMQYYFS